MLILNSKNSFPTVYINAPLGRIKKTSPMNLNTKQHKLNQLKLTGKGQ